MSSLCRFFWFALLSIPFLFSVFSSALPMNLCASLWQDRAFPSSVGRGGLLVPLQVPDALPPFLVGGRRLLLAPGGGRRFSLPNQGGEGGGVGDIGGTSGVHVGKCQGVGEGSPYAILRYICHRGAYGVRQMGSGICFFKTFTQRPAPLNKSIS